MQTSHVYFTLIGESISGIVDVNMMQMPGPAGNKMDKGPNKSNRLEQISSLVL